MREWIIGIIELVGIGLVVSFFYFVWPPAALGVAGAALILISWRLS